MPMYLRRHYANQRYYKQNEILEIEHKPPKNPNWWKVHQLAINKHAQGIETCDWSVTNPADDQIRN